MKQKDDSTLSLFDDELPVSDLQDADPSQKKLLDVQTEQAIQDRKSTRLNSSHVKRSRMPSSA